MSTTFKTTICREVLCGQEDIEIDLVVEYHITPGCRGGRDGPGGPPLEPDDEPELELLSVKNSKGEDVELTDKEQESVEEQAWEDAIADAEREPPEDDDE
jgi:hypothetical protein